MSSNSSQCSNLDMPVSQIQSMPQPTIQSNNSQQPSNYSPNHLFSPPKLRHSVSESLHQLHPTSAQEQGELLVPPPNYSPLQPHQQQLQLQQLQQQLQQQSILLQPQSQQQQQQLPQPLTSQLELAPLNFGQQQESQPNLSTFATIPIAVSDDLTSPSANPYQSPTPNNYTYKPVPGDFQPTTLSSNSSPHQISIPLHDHTNVHSFSQVDQHRHSIPNAPDAERNQNDPQSSPLQLTTNSADETFPTPVDQNTVHTDQPDDISYYGTFNDDFSYQQSYEGTLYDYNSPFQQVVEGEAFAVDDYLQQRQLEAKIRIDQQLQAESVVRQKKMFLVSLITALASYGATTHRIEYLAYKTSVALNIRSQCLIFPNMFILTFTNEGKVIDPTTSETVAGKLGGGLDLYKLQEVEALCATIYRMGKARKQEREEQRRAKKEQARAKLIEARLKQVLPSDYIMENDENDVEANLGHVQNGQKGPNDSNIQSNSNQANQANHEELNSRTFIGGIAHRWKLAQLEADRARFDVNKLNNDFDDDDNNANNNNTNNNNNNNNNDNDNNSNQQFMNTIHANSVHGTPFDPYQFYNRTSGEMQQQMLLQQQYQQYRPQQQQQQQQQQHQQQLQQQQQQQQFQQQFNTLQPPPINSNNYNPEYNLQSMFGQTQDSFGGGNLYTPTPQNTQNIASPEGDDEFIMVDILPPQPTQPVESARLSFNQSNKSQYPPSQLHNQFSPNRSQLQTQRNISQGAASLTSPQAQHLQQQVQQQRQQQKLQEQQKSSIFATSKQPQTPLSQQSQQSQQSQSFKSIFQAKPQPLPTHKTTPALSQSSTQKFSTLPLQQPLLLQEDNNLDDESNYHNWLTKMNEMYVDDDIESSSPTQQPHTLQSRPHAQPQVTTTIQLPSLNTPSANARPNTPSFQFQQNQKGPLPPPNPPPAHIASSQPDPQSTNSSTTTNNHIEPQNSPIATPAISTNLPDHNLTLQPPLPLSGQQSPHGQNSSSPSNTTPMTPEDRFTTDQLLAQLDSLNQQANLTMLLQQQVQPLQPLQLLQPLPLNNQISQLSQQQFQPMQSLPPLQPMQLSLISSGQSPIEGSISAPFAATNHSSVSPNTAQNTQMSPPNASLHTPFFPFNTNNDPNQPLDTTPSNPFTASTQSAFLLPQTNTPFLPPLQQLQSLQHLQSFPPLQSLQSLQALQSLQSFQQITPPQQQQMSPQQQPHRLSQSHTPPLMNPIVPSNLISLQPPTHMNSLQSLFSPPTPSRSSPPHQSDQLVSNQQFEKPQIIITGTQSSHIRPISRGDGLVPFGSQSPNNNYNNNNNTHIANENQTLTPAQQMLNSRRSSKSKQRRQSSSLVHSELGDLPPMETDMFDFSELHSPSHTFHSQHPDQNYSVAVDGGQLSTSFAGGPAGTQYRPPSNMYQHTLLNQQRAMHQTMLARQNNDYDLTLYKQKKEREERVKDSTPLTGKTSLKLRDRWQVLRQWKPQRFHANIDKPRTLLIALQQLVREETLYPPIFFAFVLCIQGPAAASCFFGGGKREVFLSFWLSILVAAIDYSTNFSQLMGSVQLVLSSLLVAFLCAVARVQWYGNLCMYPTMLSALIWLLPGLSITNSITELAARSMMSGTVRLVNALFSTLQMGFGLAIGMRLVLWAELDPTAPCINDISDWWTLFTFPLVSMTMNILLRAHPRQWLGMTFSSSIALFGSIWLGKVIPPQFGGDLTTILCAFLIGIFASLFSILISSEQSIVYILAGIIFLVPGSISVKGMFELFSDGANSTNFFITMLRTTSAIAVGMIASRFLLPGAQNTHASLLDVIRTSLRLKKPRPPAPQLPIIMTTVSALEALQPAAKTGNDNGNIGSTSNASPQQRPQLIAKDSLLIVNLADGELLRADLSPPNNTLQHDSPQMLRSTLLSPILDSPHALAHAHAHELHNINPDTNALPANNTNTINTAPNLDHISSLPHSSSTPIFTSLVQPDFPTSMNLSSLIEDGNSPHKHKTAPVSQMLNINPIPLETNKQIVSSAVNNINNNNENNKYIQKPLLPNAPQQKLIQKPTQTQYSAINPNILPNFSTSQPPMFSTEQHTLFEQLYSNQIQQQQQIEFLRQQLLNQQQQQALFSLQHQSNLLQSQQNQNQNQNHFLNTSQPHDQFDSSDHLPPPDIIKPKDSKFRRNPLANDHPQSHNTSPFIQLNNSSQNISNSSGLSHGQTSQESKHHRHRHHLLNKDIPDESSDDDVKFPKHISRTNSKSRPLVPPTTLTNQTSHHSHHSQRRGSTPTLSFRKDDPADGNLNNTIQSTNNKASAAKQPPSNQQSRHANGSIKGSTMQTAPPLRDFPTLSQQPSGLRSTYNGPDYQNTFTGSQQPPGLRSTYNGPDYQNTFTGSTTRRAPDYQNTFTGSHRPNGPDYQATFTGSVAPSHHSFYPSYQNTLHTLRNQQPSTIQRELMNLKSGDDSDEVSDNDRTVAPM